MLHTAEKSIPKETRKKRRAEIKTCLARHGLGNGPRMIKGSMDSLDYVERIVLALQEMGVVFTCFGQYLSTRLDCIPPSDCLILKKTGGTDRPAVDPIPILHQAYNQTTPQALSQLNEISDGVGTPLRRYSTVLSDGIRLALAMPDPVLQRTWDLDVSLLEELAPTLRQVWPVLRFKDVRTSFISDTLMALSQKDFLKWLSARGQQQEETGSEDFEMPHLEEDLSQGGLLVTSSPPGLTLAAAMAEIKHGNERVELARSICLCWLRRALMGDWFPTGPHVSNLMVLSDGRILFMGGDVATLTRPIQSNLAGYLMSVASGNPDDAFSFLIGMLLPGENSDEEVLRHRLRQAIPFRDGGWGRQDMADSLAEHLFAQWRVVGECGFQPRETFQHFCRGLGSVAHLAMVLAPEQDVLRDALYEFRLKSGLDEFRNALGFGHITEQTEHFIGLMTDISRKLENVLNRSERPQPQQKRSPRGKASGKKITLSLTVVLVALVLLSQHFAETAPLLEKLNAVCFLIVGGLMLRTLIRS